jgi:purine-binding chemotaxis protein CheW
MGVRYISFTLGGTGYCIEVDNVVEIFRRESLLEIPRAAPFVKGVISLRGDVIPVVDLRARLGQEEKTPGSARRIIVIQFGRRSCGILVDEVREIVESDEEADAKREKLPEGVRLEFVRGVARRGGMRFLVLNLAAVLTMEMASPASAERQADAATFG